MKVTAIKQQVRQPDRFSIYIDGTFCVGLSEKDVFELGIKINKEVSEEDIRQLKQASQLGKLFDKTLRYLGIRMRSEHELKQYLLKKGATTEETQQILNKLSKYGYVNDRAFARSWIEDKRTTKKRSNRRLIVDLRQKGVAKSIIEELLAGSKGEETNALQALIAKKRKISRYQDDQKLIQYLLRQGYPYDLIKTHVANPEFEQQLNFN